VAVKNGVGSGQFLIGSRMEKLDVVFANRYLEAYAQWKNNKELSSCWKLAFDATKQRSPLVLQHLLLGMNAHINLDLGIAAAELAKTQPLQNIHSDFNQINTIISSLTYEVLAELRLVSPLLSLLGLHAQNNNSVLIQFSIDNARDGAWCFAEELYAKSDADKQACIAARDKKIFELGKGLISQQGLLKFTVWLIHLFEWKKVSEIIKVLFEYKKQRFTIDESQASNKIIVSEPTVSSEVL
jgi:hypothetical protein